MTMTKERAGDDKAVADLKQVLQAPRRDSTQYRFWRRLRQHKLGMIGLTMLILLVVAAIFAPLVAGKDPVFMDLRMKNQPPSLAHLLGTDAIGRDGWGHADAAIADDPPRARG